MVRPYDTKIDDAIVQQLFTQKSMIYTALKEAVAKAIGRKTLSYETYQDHMKRLKKENTITSHCDVNRIKNRVWYSLTASLRLYVLVPYHS